ncbi:MAG: phospholipid carrier-dependent glycosyltransferase, partial [Anaerolineae bacterium]|nr:phospholipid carrier-dependent glycosyltransferase [Anaerolineae bacterium]
MSRRLRPTIEPLILIALVLAGLYLRLQKVNWDHGHLAHPDERHVLMVTDTVEWPESLAQALDVRSSPLNPFSRPGEGGVRRPETFAYGHFPVYLLKGTAAGLRALARPAEALLGRDSEVVRTLSRMTGLWEMAPLGRVLSALFDVGTIVVTFALARRLFGQRSGLLAAGLLSFTVLHVQLSHFYAVDTILGFFVTLTLYWLVRVAQGDGEGAATWAGASLALAVASKSSAAALGLAWILAFVLWEGSGGHGRRLRLAGLSAVVGAAVFLLVSPYAVLDLPMFLESFAKESRMVRGIYDFPYTRQYRKTPAFLYTVLQQLRWGMGWLPGLLAFAGLGWGVYRAVRGRVAAGVVILVAWAVPYFLITGSFMVKFMRYMAPLTPALYVLGAGLVATLAGRRRWLAWSLAGLALAYAVLWSLAFTSIYRRPFTRHQASEWIYRNVPPGSVITKEEWDDLIPYGMTVDGKPLWAEGQYEVLSFPLQEPDDAAKVDMLVDRLLRADYIVVSSNRFYGWLPRLRDRFPISNRYYELLFEGRLGFGLIREFTSYPSLGPFTFVDDRADESFTVYDHPKVMVFGRTATLTEGELRSLFQPYLTQAASERRDEALLLPVPVDRYPSVADFGWNAWADDGLAAAAWWWLVASAVGLAAWPLTHRLLGRLWAGGWPLARVVGLALTAYPVWLGASLGVTSNTVGASLLSLGCLTLIGLV